MSISCDSFDSIRRIITLIHLFLGIFLFTFTDGSTSEYVFILFGFPLIFIIPFFLGCILSLFKIEFMLPAWLGVTIIATTWVGNSYLVGYIAYRYLLWRAQK
jgi:hypothetical protein